MKTEIQTYTTLLRHIKQRVTQAQQRAFFSANEEMLRMYWDVGEMLTGSQMEDGWGQKTLERLSVDLKNEFPKIKGFSVRNMQFMMQFYEEYNKELTLPKCYTPGIAKLPISQLNKNTETDIDMLTFTDEYNERDVEIGLVKHVEQFLVEMGAGFGFMGRQYHIEVSGDDYYIDLLMYNAFMHRYLVVELKNTDFKPEYIGKLNFYCSAVDDILCREGDNRTIGLLLCKTKDKVKAEYALRDIIKPIGISDYELGQVLPNDFSGSLPTIEEIESEFEDSGNKEYEE